MSNPNKWFEYNGLNILDCTTFEGRGIIVRWPGNHRQLGEYNSIEEAKEAIDIAQLERQRQKYYWL